MKKASETLLLVGAILEIVMAATMILVGIIMLVLASPVFTDFLREVAEKESNQAEIEAVIKLLKSTYLSIGIGFLTVAVISGIGSIFTFQAHAKKTRGLYITSVVFGILSGTYVASVGGIFGLIVQNREGEVIDVKAEDPEE